MKKCCVSEFKRLIDQGRKEREARGKAEEQERLRQQNIFLTYLEESQLLATGVAVHTCNGVKVDLDGLTTGFIPLAVFEGLKCIGSINIERQYIMVYAHKLADLSKLCKRFGISKIEGEHPHKKRIRELKAEIACLEKQVQ